MSFHFAVTAFIITVHTCVEILPVHGKEENIPVLNQPLKYWFRNENVKKKNLEFFI